MDADDVKNLPNGASYVAGGPEFFYPRAGDPKPPPGAKVDLLTIGHVCTQGTWNDAFLGWAPLPTRNTEKEKKIAR